MNPTNPPRAAGFACAALALLVSGCATAPREFETPQGPRSGDQLSAFEILGVLSRNTSTLHRPNGQQFFQETVTVNVPPGTDIIVPAMRGYAIGYGRTAPDDLSALNTSTFTWFREDHNLGLAALNVFVEDINAVDTSTTPPSQTAKITIMALLSDDNGDDGWFGTVNYNLLCLGRKNQR